MFKAPPLTGKTLEEVSGFVGVVPHFHFPLCDWLWVNHVTNVWDFTSRCSRSERPSETVSDVVYTIGQDWWPKRVCFYASRENVWLQWIQTFAKVESRIRIVRTGRFGCFPTFPTRLGISCDTLPEFSARETQCCSWVGQSAANAVVKSQIPTGQVEMMSIPLNNRCTVVEGLGLFVVDHLKL